MLSAPQRDEQRPGRIGVVTSDQPRHRYFLNTLAQAFHVAAVVIEPKLFDPSQAHETPEDAHLLQRYFEARAESETRFFGLEPALVVSADRMRAVPAGGINDLAAVRHLVDGDVQVVCVFGSSILKAPFLEQGDWQLINLHLGLSPYYRGSGTNFFPFVNGELACVGATIHKLTDVVDGGSIYRQVRPALELGDSIHDAGNKAILAGTDAMVRTVREALEGRLCGRDVRHADGRLCRRRDFNAEQVRRAMARVEAGLVFEYLASKTEHDARVPIVE